MRSGRVAFRPRWPGGAGLRTGRTGRVFACRALIVALAACAPGFAVEEGTEIRWKESFSGQTEISLGQSYDLDFANPKESEFDVQLEDWEGGMFWAPRRGARAALVGVVDFDALDLGRIDGLNPSRERIALVSGGVPAVSPGTVIAVITSDTRYAKVSIDSCGETVKIHWVTYDRLVLRRAPPRGALEAPVLKSPPDSVLFEHSPRDLLLAWGSVLGAASYTLELDCQGCCPPRKELFCGDQENGSAFMVKTGLTTTAFYTTWVGPRPGRWRVSAVGADGRTGPWSAWSTFSFK